MTRADKVDFVFQGSKQLEYADTSDVACIVRAFNVGVEANNAADTELSQEETLCVQYLKEAVFVKGQILLDEARSL